MDIKKQCKFPSKNIFPDLITYGILTRILTKKIFLAIWGIDYRRDTLMMGKIYETKLESKIFKVDNRLSNCENNSLKAIRILHYFIL